MDGYTTITIDSGTVSGTFYIPANQIQFLDQETLVNTGSSSITLYRDIANSSSYYRERIVCASFTQPVYYSGSGSSNGVYLSDASITSYSPLAQLYRDSYLFEPLLIFLLFLLVTLKVVKRR